MNNLWTYVGEYQSSILPKAESRSIPWELRKLKTNSLVETDSKTSTRKKRSKTSISKTCDDKEAIMSEASCAVDIGSKMEDVITENHFNGLSCLETEDPQKTVTVATTDLACDANYSCDPVNTNEELSSLESQDPQKKV